MNLILIGYKGSGKTYFGHLFACESGRDFIDIDERIEELYEKQFQEHLSCRQISLKLGQERFRFLEKTAISSMGERENTIISTGGGSILDWENCRILRQMGIRVYIEMEKEAIKQRMFSDGIPSFLDLADPDGSFENIYIERKAIYEAESDVRIKVCGKTDQMILNELRECLD